MPEVVWYRSLYWRIASGFVALLAALLVVQGLVFLWMTGRMTEVFPTRSPAQFATALASDVGAVLIEQPGVDLHTYINSNYNSSYRGYVVVLADGRTFTSERVPPPPALARSARFRLLADRGDDPMRPQGRSWLDRGRSGGGPSGRTMRAGRGGGADGGLPGGVEYARVLDAGTVIGIVAVPREAPPMSVAMRDLGPTLAAVALGLLAAGTAISALLIFRPTRRRLSQLQNAARAIGAGAVGVRAPDQGGDEVTSLSRAFNDMAVQLEQRTNALEAADRTRRQLLADVSHELMTPLAAIRGYVETLQMADLRLEEGARTRYLAIVSDESERLEQIIGDLLELARLEGGGGGLRSDTVSVSQLLERVRHRHEPVLDDKRIVLDASEDPSVGVFRGDQYRLEQALQNLVANAIRHTPPGGRVSVRAVRQGDTVILSVEDTGEGIPNEHLGRIFDRFYKVDESRTGTKLQSGSGLGLSIVQAIVARHGGTVRASSVAGAGARFEIRLPAHPPEGEAFE
jgi:signal transduction histidine kinase